VYDETHQRTRCNSASTRPGFAKLRESLDEVGFHSAVEFLASYAGRASDLGPLLIGAQINDDLNLRLQYLAGLGLNSMAAPQIYRDVLTYRRFPEGFLVGTAAAWMRCGRYCRRRAERRKQGAADSAILRFRGLGSAADRMNPVRRLKPGFQPAPH
jgi:hypothetical protein